MKRCDDDDEKKKKKKKKRSARSSTRRRLFCDSLIRARANNSAAVAVTLSERVIDPPASIDWNRLSLSLSLSHTHTATQPFWHLRHLWHLWRLWRLWPPSAGASQCGRWVRAPFSPVASKTRLKTMALTGFLPSFRIVFFMPSGQESRFSHWIQMKV